MQVSHSQSEWLQEHLSRTVNDSEVDGVMLQYPLPDHLHLAVNTADGLIPRHKNVDAIFFEQSDWRDLPGDYLTSDAELRAVPCIAAHQVIRHCATGRSFEEALLIGDDPVNMPALRSFLKTYLGNNKRLHEFSGAPPADFEFQQPLLVVTCLNRPQTLRSSMFGEDSLVLDFGYSFDGSRIIGDVLLECDRQTGQNPLIFSAPSGPNSLIDHCLLRNLYVSWKKSTLG